MCPLWGKWGPGYTGDRYPLRAHLLDTALAALGLPRTRGGVSAPPGGPRGEGGLRREDHVWGGCGAPVYMGDRSNSRRFFIAVRLLSLLDAEDFLLSP